MARNWVLSRCLQGYEWCAHRCLLRCVWRFWVGIYLSSHKSYCISKLVPSFSITQYFSAINCIYNTSLEAHICFQLIVHYRCNFPYAYNIEMQMNTPTCMFCACGCVFNIHYSDLWAQVMLMMSTCGYRVHLSVAVLACINGAIFLFPVYSCSQIHNLQCASYISYLCNDLLCVCNSHYFVQLLHN